MDEVFSSSAGCQKTKEEWLAWAQPIFHKKQKTRQSGEVLAPVDLWERLVSVLELETTESITYTRTRSL